MGQSAVSVFSIRLVCVLALVALLAACTPAPVLPPTPSTVPANAPSPSATMALPPATVPATAAPAATGTPPPASRYLDDRSSPWSLMLSFADALNSHEYLRAYSYWEPDAVQLQPFGQFEQGYADLAAVTLTIGDVTSDAGAGQFYYSVPVTMIAAMNGGTTQTSVGCYVLHESNPGMQGVPPFAPLGIRSATVQTVADGTDTAPLLAQACAAGGTPQGVPMPTPPTPVGTGATFYLNDRSDGAELMRSFVNALNRHEIVRAYSYWEPYSQQLQPFDQFEQGYADTQSVQLVLGQITSGAAAGNFYYHVPVTFISTSTAGAVTTYVGCYTLHLGSPSAQATPPFMPLGIESATVQQVPDGTDTTAMMAVACSQQ